jgi:hypothetical protein
VTNDTIICANESVTIVASGSATSYNWSNGVSTNAFTVSPTLTTVYTVTATDASTCAVVDSVTVTVNSPTVYLGPDITLIDTVDYILDAGFGYDYYLWNTGDTTQTITINAYVNAQLGLNKYVVEVGDVYGCFSRDSINIRYLLDIADYSQELSFDVFPNPTKGMFNLSIEGADKQTYKLEIVNIQGQRILVKELDVNQGTYNDKMDLSTLPKGIYMIHLRNDNYISTKKLIIQ